MELNEKNFAKGLYFSMKREDLPRTLHVGWEYQSVIAGHQPIPIGKKTILMLETGVESRGLPEAVIQFTKYQFRTVGNEKATEIKFRLEEFLN
jgi:hypothetical protein